MSKGIQHIGWHESRIKFYDLTAFNIKSRQCESIECKSIKAEKSEVLRAEQNHNRPFFIRNLFLKKVGAFRSPLVN
jgi:hypothetical protein